MPRLPLLAASLAFAAVAFPRTSFADDPRATVKAAETADPGAPAAPTAPAPEDAPITYTRRGGFTVGISVAGAAGAVAGYPNDARKVNRPEFYSDLGAAYGGAGTAWFGVGFTDWVTFGLGLGGRYLASSKTEVSGVGFVFHVELFPLFFMGGPFRELGLMFDTGIGSYVAPDPTPAGTPGAYVPPLVDSGAASRFGAGVFYEGVRFSRFSLGPYVAFDHAWSGTMSAPLVFAGVRTELYTRQK